MQHVADNGNTTTLQAGRTTAGSPEHPAAVFLSMLDERIDLIEGSFRSLRPGQWAAAISGLVSSARAAGADRLEGTAARLLGLEEPDAQTTVTLIGQLRSDARVLKLAHAAQCSEQALAERLAARRPA